MTGTAHRWRLTWSIALWWLLLALILWLLGTALGESASVTRCTASAALLVAIGELGDWLRRRWWADHTRRVRRSQG
ncbi:hypothetical protein AB0D57_08880 [Streptomyces sp. NPDC048275]|uniref:hypothetical protein n=1 Tax=Streptomyces sp. NPDC048275 TaxID=3155629 RepID=UPI0033E00040